MAESSVKTPEQEHSDQELWAMEVSSHSAATQNSTRNIRLIIGREYRNRVTQRSFRISSIILLFVVFIGPFIPTLVQWVQSHTAQAISQTHVVVVNDAGPIAGMTGTALIAYISSQLNGTNPPSPTPYAITSQPPTSLDTLQNQITQGNLDILLVMNRSPQGDLQFQYETDADPNSDSNLTGIQTLAQYLTVLDTANRLGLTSSQTARLFAPATLTTAYPHPIQNARPENQLIVGYILAFAGAFLIYVAVSLYSSIVAAGVAEEKSNRVMEILVNAATPFQLLAGKIVGIGTACLTQMGALVVVGIGALLLQSPLQTALFGTSAGGYSQYLAGVFIPFYLLFLVYFLLAFFLYATLYAGLSAMIKRQDEVQNATLVPTLLIVCMWLVFYIAAASPNAPVTQFLSYIPFFTPTVMLVRIAVGTVAWWEIVTTIVLMLGAIFVCASFAARLYRLGVLMYGQRPGLGQLLNMTRTN